MSGANQKMTRRSLLKVAAMGSVGALAAACAPQKVTVEVTKEVVVTSIVEKEVQKEVVVTAVPQAGPPVEITYWQAPIWRYGKDNKTPNAPVDEWINYSVEKFQEANPDIKVQLELIPWDNWGAKVNAAFASGTLPNLLYGTPAADKVLAGVFDPIDEYVTDDIKANWSPAMLAACTLFGRVYGIPTIGNPNMFALSKTALEKNGGADLLPKNEMRTFTIQDMEKMAAAFSDGKTRYAYGIPLGDHPASIYFDMAQAMTGRGVQWWDEGFERFIAHENPRSVEALQWFVDSLGKGWIIPNLPKWSDVDTFYWTLNCAGRGQWPGIQTELETAQAAGQASSPFEIMLVSWPYDEKLEPFAAGTNGGGAFGLGKTSEANKRAAAFRLGNYYASEAWIGETWLVNGFFPTSKTQIAFVKDNPLLQDPNKRWVLDTYLTKYKPEPVTGQPMTVQNPRTAKILGDNKIIDYSASGYYIRSFQSLLLGQTTPETMMQDMAKTINTALGAKV